MAAQASECFAYACAFCGSVSYVRRLFSRLGLEKDTWLSKQARLKGCWFACHGRAGGPGRAERTHVEVARWLVHIDPGLLKDPGIERTFRAMGGYGDAAPPP